MEIWKLFHIFDDFIVQSYTENYIMGSEVIIKMNSL